MKILSISTVENIGGASSSAYNLFDEYRRRGHDSWLVVGKRQTPDPDVIEIPGRGEVCLWNRLWSNLEKRYPPSAPRIGAFILRELRQFWGWKNWALDHSGRDLLHFPGTFRILSMLPNAPEIVHCHNLHPHYFDFRYLPILSQKAPLVINMRDSWMATGHCAYSQTCEKYKTGCGSCPDLAIYPAIRRDATAANWKMRREILGRCTTYLTAPSQWQLDVGLESGLPHVLAKVIPNAIRFDNFTVGDREQARRKLDLPSNAFITAYFAHHAFKDSDFIEKAMAMIKPNLCKPMIFLCIGRKEAGESSLGLGILRSVGYIKDERLLADYYRASNVYVHAAKGESFGKTVVEAMACGIPAAVTNFAGPAEIVVDGQTGFLASPKDPGDLARVIQELLDNPEKADAFGRAGAERARANYSLDRQVRAFLEWYEEVREDWLRRNSCNSRSN